MSGSNNGYISDSARTNGSVTKRKPAVPGASMNEIIDRAFREPYYRFLLFLAAIWRNWYWALPFSLILGGAFGVSAYYFSKDRYTSEAWIQVHPQPPYIAFPSQQNLASSMAIVLSALQTIYSPPVMDDAWSRIAEKADSEGIDISEITKKREPIRWLSSNINLRQRGESSTYVVSFTTTNPRLSQLIMESILASYMAFMGNSSSTRSGTDITNLEEFVRLKKFEIEGLSKEYDRLAASIARQGGDLPSELNSRMTLATQSLPYQIIGLEAEIASQQILIELNQKVLDDEDDGSALPDSEVEASLYRHPVILQLLTEKIALLDDLEKNTPRFKSEDADYLQKIRKKISEVENRIEKARDELLPELKKQWKATLRQMAHQEKLSTENRIEQLNKQIDSLKEANLKNLTKEESVVKDVNAAMEILTQRNREEQIYNILMQRVGMLRTELRAQSMVDQISNANLPNLPDGSQRFRTSLMMLVLGLVIPMLLAWGRELRNPRFYHLSQFPTMFSNVSPETVAGLPRAGREAGMNRREKDAFYFSVDKICNNYCYGKWFARSGVFLFSSVQNDDGQTLLALSVAERIAQMKKKPVLLVDTHGNSPRLRNLIGIESKASLADILAMRLSINDAIIRDSQQPNLFFLPDGPSANDSSIELFSDGTFEMLLKELRNHYSTIIISTRPMERASVSHLLCNFADEVVLALRLYDTSRKNTERLYERLFDVGKPVTSFLISGISK